MKRHFHRRNLPHLYYDEGIYFITYHQANSIPISKLRQMQQVSDMSAFDKFKRLFMRYDKLLALDDYGVSYLSNENIANICRDTLQFPNGKDYSLIAYCIMPNHVHLVFELINRNKSISDIMKGVKGVSARRINKYLNRSGTFWQDESYDRLVRDDVELYFVIKYVLLNPVEANLVDDWQDWNYTFCHKDYLVF